MRVRATILALSLAVVAHPAGAQTHGGCTTSPAKFAGQGPTFTLPPELKNTSKTIAFEIDIGSDGRVRGLQMDQNSGDGAVDLSLRQTLQAAAYEPPQTGCVAYSGSMYVRYDLPAPYAPQSATPPKLNTNCTPYVLAFLSPAPRDRRRTGSATVAVELDAAGTQTATPVLRKSSGSPVLDAEALRIAKTGQYNFLRESSCVPQPFTYNLELTFE
jgi:TonB family protein